MPTEETLHTMTITHPCFDPLHLVATESGMSRPATAEEIAMIEQSTTEMTGATPMTTEKIKLEIRICPETQKPFVCDQHGRSVAAVLNSVISSGVKQVAQVTMTAHLHADGKKYTGKCNKSVRDLTPLERGEAIHKAMLDDAQESPSMKLVDILARELKVWPDALVDFARQDYDKEIRFYSIDNGEEMGLEQYDFYVDNRADDGCDYKTVAGGGVKVTRAEWQAAVDALNAPKVDIIDGNMRLGALIEMGYLIDPFKHDPSYRISCNWPRQRYCIDPIPGLQYRKQSADQAQEAALDPKDCLEFLKSRIAELEAQNIELVRQSWLPNKEAAAARDRIETLEDGNEGMMHALLKESEKSKDLSSKIESLEAELAERREETKHPINLLLSDADLLFLLRSESRVSAVNIPIGRSGSIIIRRADAGDSLKG